MRRRADGYIVLWLSGELSAANRGDLHVVLHRLLLHDACDLIVDVSDVTFVDGSAVGELAEANLALHARRSTLRIRGASAIFRRILEILKMDELLAPDRPSTTDARATGAALRHLGETLGVARAEARAALDQVSHRYGWSQQDAAAKILAGTIPLHEIHSPAAAARTSASVSTSDAIRKRVEREYVVCRVEGALDETKADALRRNLGEDVANADVVIDLRECASGTAEALAVLAELDADLVGQGSVLILREPTASLIASLVAGGSGDPLSAFTVRRDAPARPRRSGGADASRR